MSKVQLTKVFGVYQIKNLSTGKVYIGSTTKSFSSRWKQWLYNLRKQKGNAYLQNAWNKYGEENFSFEILEIIEDKAKVLEREQYWIDLIGFSNLYNLCPKAGSPNIKIPQEKEVYCPICNSQIIKCEDGRYRKTCGKRECINTLANQEGKLSHRFGKRSQKPCPICGKQRKECYTSNGEFNKYQRTCGDRGCIVIAKGWPKGIKRT